jgi:hypothetical protein
MATGAYRLRRWPTGVVKAFALTVTKNTLVTTIAFAGVSFFGWRGDQ